VETEKRGDIPDVPPDRIPKVIEDLTKQMFAAARDLEFEKAAQLRDQIKELENTLIRYGQPSATIRKTEIRDVSRGPGRGSRSSRKTGRTVKGRE
jgi:excinuclease UvrABC nuclease subunit